VDFVDRDFTMNALFYNLNTKEVEDLTQRGLSDLAAGMFTYKATFWMRTYPPVFFH
jgi:tRNA nucleotidyltransferase/poly(A) polymerase